MLNFQFLKKAELEALASAFRGGKLALPVTTFALQRYVAQERTAEMASQFGHLHAMGFQGPQVALLLETVTAQVDNHAGGGMELVVTGPDVPGIALRDTSVVVRELFAKARQEVLVVGYAVYQGRQVFAALAENMEKNPGLKVTMCLDVQRSHADTSMASEVVFRFIQRFKEKEWPGKRLPDIYYDPRSLELDHGAKAALHAKCVVIDRSECFISSANFTEAAQERNIEVGMLAKDPAQAQVLAAYFEGLIGAGVLKRIV